MHARALAAGTKPTTGCGGLFRAARARGARGPARLERLGGLLVVLAELEVVLGRVLELGVVELGQVAHHVLIDRVGHEHHLQALLQQLLQEGRLGQLLLGSACAPARERADPNPILQERL